MMNWRRRRCVLSPFLFPIQRDATPRRAQTHSHRWKMLSIFECSFHFRIREWKWRKMNRTKNMSPASLLRHQLISSSAWVACVCVCAQCSMLAHQSTHYFQFASSARETVMYGVYLVHDSTLIVHSALWTPSSQNWWCAQSRSKFIFHFIIFPRMENFHIKRHKTYIQRNMLDDCTTCDIIINFVPIEWPAHVSVWVPHLWCDFAHRNWY